MDNQSPQKLDEMPVLDLITKIKEGVVDPKLLYKSTRQLCVETLFVEGVHISKIAGLFKVSDRTIRRDIADMREKNAVAPSPEMTRAILGELVTNGRHHYSSLRQIARLKDAYPDEKARAEYLAWRVGKELVDRLFQAGFLVAADQPLENDTKKKVDETVYFTPKQKEIREMCLALTPIEKEKLVEKLRRDILAIGEQIEELKQEEPGTGGEEVK
jgi:hypothetical protein